MNRKVVKFVAILLVAIMAVTMLSTSVFANWDDLGTDMFDDYEDKSTASKTTTQVIGALINVIQVVGMGIAIVMLIVMAIKYISAAPSEKAEIKKSIMIYVVGAIVLFAASGILGIIKNFATTNINEVENNTENGKTGAIVRYIENDDIVA